MEKAEILAIGDELLYGRVYDTNSFWIADQVTRLGVIVQRITCVRDDLDAICIVLREILSRNPSFIFITGGLGPTEDDKTLEALAKFTERKVVVDENVLKLMAERRKISQSQFLPRHYKMCSTIEGAKCLPSPIGWSPLTILKIGKTTVFALPGPPKEVQSCFTTYITEEIQKVTQNYSLPKRMIIKMRELDLAPLVSHISKIIPEVYIKPLVSEYVPERGMVVEIIVFGDGENSCKKKYGLVSEIFKELLERKGKEISEYK